MAVEAFVRGVAMTPFGKTPERTLEQLAHPSIVEAVCEAELAPGDIDAIVGGSYATGVLTAQRAVRGLDLSNRPILNVENACASSSSAFQEAVQAVRHGIHANVLVLGIEQLSRHESSLLPLDEDEPDVKLGAVMPAIYAMRARRHQAQFGTTAEHLAKVAVKSHANGALNPLARFRKPVTLEEVLGSRTIAEPLTLLQCSSGGDGAAAVVVSHKPHPHVRIRVTATAASAGLETDQSRDMAVSNLTQSVGHEAYEQASLGPEDVDVAELHDAFTIAELMYYEALGLCAPGDGVDLLEKGETRLDGRIPVNPSGGLLSRGHPVGATGAAQIAELFWQMAGRAGRRQVSRDVRVGLTHTTGGGIAGYDHGACAINILVRET